MRAPGGDQESTYLDKDFLREYLRRMGYTGEGPPPVIPAPVIKEVSKRCVAARAEDLGYPGLVSHRIKPPDFETHV
ncbi:MAG: hypothetical protein JSV27_03720 [Candidatus Bathyarchaeota archaeon]|nr:MAG: hypothetical protein JSV27_03720 [Candidatus Bathyarchaeota archaeon]